MRMIGISLFLMLSAGATFAADVDGKAVYVKACNKCHSPDGAGNPAVAKQLKIDQG